MSTARPVAIAYLDGRRLRRALLAGIQRVVDQRGHLDRINVFPVPDGDTGTNLSLTLSAIAERLAVTDTRHGGELLAAAADAAVDGARGNSGAIFAQFFQGLAEELGDLPRLGPGDLGRGLAAADRCARAALAEPREGTVLTVMTAAAGALAPGGLAPADRDFTAAFRRLLVAARAAEDGTRNTLDALRAAGVEDAGALGLLLLFEGMADALQPGLAPVQARATDTDAPLRDHVHAGEPGPLEHRFCTECIVTGAAIDRERLGRELAAIGSSVVVVGGRQKVRLHCHVNDPAAAFAIARRHGEVRSEKADDMARQGLSLRAPGQRVAVVTDSAADLPDGLWDELGIQMVPLRVNFGEQSYLDKAGLSAGDFFRKLRENPVPPRTSQPAPGDFRRAYELLSSHFEHVVVVSLASRLSGTFQAAVTAAGRMGPGRVTVLDSRTATGGQGLIARYAAEQARAGLDAPEIVARVEAIIGRTRTYGFVPDLHHAVRGGRLPRPWNWLAARLPVSFTVSTDGQGRIRVRALGGRGADPVAALLGPARRDTPIGVPLRICVAHANCPEAAGRLVAACRDAFPAATEVLLTELGPAIGAHGGPGTLTLAIQESPTPDQPQARLRA